MNLVFAKKAEPNVPSIKRGAFVLFARTGQDADLRKLESKTLKLYVFVTEVGAIGTTAILSKTPPTAVFGAKHFVGDNVNFEIDTYPALDKEDRSLLARETLKLRGSRIQPTYMEVTKTTILQEGNAAYVEGTLFHAIDPRLEYMDAEENTVFGVGELMVENVKGHHSGSYYNVVLSPWSKEIEEAAVEQMTLFGELSAAAGDQKKQLERELEISRRMLKPHAYQIYKYDADHIYFVNGQGYAEATWIGGLRSLDIHDRARLRKFLDDASLSEEELRSQRESLYQYPPQARFAMRKIAPALEREVRRSKARDEIALAELQDKNVKLTPFDGPLGAKDLPGLRPGVRFLPHQPYILATLKDNLRQLVDAAPGAGKSIIIICDILHQMKAGTLKRPIVIMPDDLLSQFAGQIKVFSELNPWIINTESVQKWRKTDNKDDALALFLQDAHDAPPNTVFLTSYDWLSDAKQSIPSGGTVTVELDAAGDEVNRHTTNTSVVFPRPHSLMDVLGIDAVYCDEVHVLKNDSDQTKATLSMARLKVVRGLTGTIMPGNLIDVTGPAGFVHSGLFGSTDDFLSDFSADGTPNLYREDSPKRIRERLSKYGVPQVRQSAWAKVLPPSEHLHHFVDFTPNQQKAYDAILEGTLEEIRKDPILSARLAKLDRNLADEDLSISGPLLSKFVPLETFVNSPDAIKGWKSVLVADDAISPKAAIIADICHKHLAIANNGKILILCQFGESAHGIYNALPPDLKEVAEYYEGGMISVLDRLKNPSDPLKIMVGIDRTLRTGHNIQSVNCIIHADLLWLPGLMQQREARAVRIGQTRNVSVHYILTRGSSEMLKMARLVSADHTIAKANSDFNDKEVLQPIVMSLDNMRTFRKEDQLKPFIDRKADIKRFTTKQADVDAKKFGEKLMEPKGNASIAEVFGDKAKMLRKVPSNKTYKGDAKNIESLLEEELDKLPEKPITPKLLEFHLKKIGEDWAIVCYYTTDPQGWLRRLRFNMSRTMWFLETGSKPGALSVLDQIEDANLEIVDREELESIINGTRVTDSGKKNTIQRTEKASRTRTRKKIKVEVEAANTPKGEIALNFGLFDGTPVLWADTLDEGDVELKTLRSLGFRPEPSFWYMFTSRTSIVRLLTRIQQIYPEVRLTGWDKFKTVVNQAFRGVDLTGYDALGVE